MNTALRQALFYGVGLVIMKGISFVMLPIVTRYLPVEVYGRLDVLVTLMNLGSIVIGFGLVEAVYRYSGAAETEQERQQIVTTGLIINGLFAIVFLLLTLPLSVFMLHYLPGDIEPQHLHLALINIVIGGVINIPLAWLRMRNQAQCFLVFTTVKALFQASTTFWLLEVGLGISGVLWSGLVSNTLLMVALLLFQVRTTGFRPRFSLSGPLILYGLPLVLSGCCLFVTNGLERWIIAAYSDTAALANYGVAAMFALVVAFLIEPFTLWWYPKRFEYLQRGHGKLLNAYYASLGVSLCIVAAMIVILLGPSTISLLLPGDYHGAAQLLPVLVLAMAIKQIANLMNIGCFVGSTTVLPTQINAGIAVLAGLLYPLSAIYYQVQGIVYAVLIVNVIRAGLFYCLSQRALPLVYPLAFLGRQFSLLCAVVLLHELLPILVPVLSSNLFPLLTTAPLSTSTSNSEFGYFGFDIVQLLNLVFVIIAILQCRQFIKQSNCQPDGLCSVQRR